MECFAGNPVHPALLRYLTTQNFVAPFPAVQTIELIAIFLQMFKEFCRQTSANETEIIQRWIKIEQQIFEYATLEEKRVVKDLLVQYNAVDEVTVNAGNFN